jgi:hypothetical protein
MRIILAALVLAVAVVSAGHADGVSLQLKDASLETVAAKLSEQAKAYVLADPVVNAKVSVSINNVTLEKALDIVCMGSELGWYLVKMDLPKDAEPDAAQVAGIVRILATMETDTFIAEQPSGPLRAQIRRGDASATPEVEPAAAIPDGLTKAYLLTSADFKTPAPAATRVDKMLDIQRQSMKLMLQMTPEETTEMMERSMEVFMNMDPREKAAMMNRTLLSISKMDPEKFRGMVGEFIGIAKDIPPETLKALADMWGVDPDQQDKAVPPPGG